MRCDWCMSNCRILDSLIHSQSVSPLTQGNAFAYWKWQCDIRAILPIEVLFIVLSVWIFSHIRHSTTDETSNIRLLHIIHVPPNICSLHFLFPWFYRRCETMRTTKTLLSNNADKTIDDWKFSWSCEVKTSKPLSPYIDVSRCMRKMMRTPINRRMVWRGMSIYNYWEQITWFLYHSSFFAFLLCFLDMRRLRKNLGSICNRIMFEEVKRWWSKVRGFPGYWLYFPIIPASLNQLDIHANLLLLRIWRSNP